MSHRAHSLALLLAWVTPGLVHAADYHVQAGSTLNFAGSFQGSSFEGRFSQWMAQIRYDPAKLAACQFDVTIQLASARTGDNDRDSALPGPDFFDVAKYPQAHFITTAFRQQGGQVIADGMLTLRGVTRPVSLNVIFKPQGKAATLDVNGTLKRLDFDVGSGQYTDTAVIGPDVKVTAHLILDAK